MNSSQEVDHLFKAAKEILWKDKATDAPMSEETKARLLEQAAKLVEITVSRLLYSTKDNKGNIFWGHVFLLLRRDFSYQLQVSAAVSIDSKGPLLHINPYMLLNQCQTIQELQDRLTHEGYHLLYNHIGLYGQQLQKKDSDQQLAINIGTDVEINQWLENMPEGSLTLETVRHLTEKQEIPEKAGSIHYINALLASFQKNQEALEANQQVVSADGEDQGQSTQGEERGLQSDLEEEDTREGQTKQGAETEDDSSQKNQDKKSQTENPSQQKEKNEHQRLFNKGDGVVRVPEKNANEHETWEQSVSPSYAKSLAKELFDAAEDQAREGGKSRGLMPAHIEEALMQLRKPSLLSWQVYFKKALSFTPKGKKPSINRLHRRMPERLDKRGKLTGEGKNVVVFLDASGSMTASEIEKSLNECYRLSKLQNMRLFTGQIDTEVADFYEIKHPTDLKFERKAGGGTTMQAGFDYLEAHQFDRRSEIVFFTDGFFENQINDCGFKRVLWILTSPDYCLPEGIRGQVAYLKKEEQFGDG